MYTFTSSEIDTYLACRRKHNFRYAQKIVPVQSDISLDFGSAVHEGLRDFFTWYYERGDDLDKSMRIAIDSAVEYATENNLDPVTISKVSAMVEAYCTYWAEHKNDDCIKNYDVLDVEQTYDLNLSDFCIAGKIDALLKEKDTGRIYILDHKTASNPDEDYFDKVRFDNQMMFYAMIIDALLGDNSFLERYNLDEKTEIGGIIYDVLSKPAIRQKKGETDSEFLDRYKQSASFTRHVVSIDNRLTTYLYSQKVEILQLCEEMAKKYDSALPNTRNCLVYGTCPYFNLCKCLINRVAFESELGCEYKRMRIHSELDEQYSHEKEN